MEKNYFCRLTGCSISNKIPNTKLLELFFFYLYIYTILQFKRIVLLNGKTEPQIKHDWQLKPSGTAIKPVKNNISTTKFHRFN